jgi:hypothetical protein
VDSTNDQLLDSAVLPFDEDDYSSEPHCTEDQPDPANDQQLDSVAIPFNEDHDYGRVCVDNIIVVANPMAAAACWSVTGNLFWSSNAKMMFGNFFMHKGDNSILFSRVSYLSSL